MDSSKLTFAMANSRKCLYFRNHHHHHHHNKDLMIGFSADESLHCLRHQAMTKISSATISANTIATTIDVLVLHSRAFVYTYNAQAKKEEDNIEVSY